MRLTLFDLDHTLLDGDSDQLWCEFLMARGVLPRDPFESLNRAMARDYAAGRVGARLELGLDELQQMVVTLPEFTGPENPPKPAHLEAILWTWMRLADEQGVLPHERHVAEPSRQQQKR